MRPAARTEPDEWARDNREYPASAGIPGPRNPYLTGYMVPFARKAHAATHRRVVAVTAAQSGKTDNLLDIIGARLDQRPTPILYAGPSKEFVQDQFEPRLMMLLDEAKTLAAKVSRGKRMKKSLKFVAGVKVRLGSAGSSTSLKSDPFGLGIVDEYDEMTANIKGQGDPLGLVEARGETYADFVTAIVSTPSVGIVGVEIDPVNGLTMWSPGDKEQILSPIWRLWQQGTRHHFAWPCPHCGDFFIPRFEHLKWPKGATPAQARREAHIECPSNGCIITDADKPEMIAGGVQIAPGQTIDQAFAGENEPDNSTWSCWTSGLCSPFVTFGERAEKYLNAYLSGEPDKIQTVMNAAFGECFDVSAGADVPAWEEVLKHRLPYVQGMVPAGGIRLAMAVDVQKFSLIYGIRAFGARGTSWLVDHGQLYGPTDDNAVWADLADLFLNPVGGMQIEKVFIDSGFRPDKPDQGSEHKVYEFCRRFGWICSPTKGRAVQRMPYQISKIEVKPDGKKTLYSINLVTLSTDFFKSLVMARIKTPLDAPGAFFLHEKADEDYAKQITSEARIIEDGKPKWVARSKQNHFLDVEAMLAAIGYVMNVQRIPEGVERPPTDPEWLPDDGSAPAATDDQPATAVPPPKLGGSGKDIRSRFSGLGSRLNR